MKADSVAVFLKGVGFIGGAIAAQLAGSLAQWANSGTWPDRINWILIITLAVLQGCNSMVTFASGAWSNWRDAARKVNAVDNKPTTP